MNHRLYLSSVFVIVNSAARTLAKDSIYFQFHDL